MRIPHHGTPGSMEAGTLEAAGGATLFPEMAGGPMLAVQISEWLGLEAGAEVHSGGWALGFTGARFTRTIGNHSGDLEIGLGGGAGGTYCDKSVYDPCDYDDDYGCGDCGSKSARKWYERTAFGGLAGIGMGFHFKWFSFFFRARVQISGARDTPETIWASLAHGLQVRIPGLLRFYVAGGLYKYHNTMDEWMTPFVEVGLALSFGMKRSRALPE